MGRFLLRFILVVVGLWAARFVILHLPLSAYAIASAEFQVTHLGMPGQPAYWVTVKPDGQVIYETGLSDKGPSESKSKQLTADELARFRTLLRRVPLLVGTYDTGTTAHSHLYLELTPASGPKRVISLQHGARPVKVESFMTELNAILGEDWEI